MSPSPSARAAETATLIFDFDGTVSLGDGPMLAYARCVGAALGPDAALAALQGAAEPWRVTGPGGVAARDGYDAVRIVAELHGIGPDVLQQAYNDSRLQLATDHAPITPAAGLDEVLRAAEGKAWRILATNSPSVRLEEALAALGLEGLFDEIRPSLGKPAGLVPLVRERIALGPVMCVGDIWVNDLAPGAELGAATALVCPPALVPEDAAPDLVGETFADIADGLAAWVELVAS